MVALLLGFHVAPEDRIDPGARDDAAVLRFFDLRAGYGDDLRHVDAAFVEQAADDGQILDIDRPHDVALVHGVDVVDLDADVARGMLAREGVQLGTLEHGHLPLGLGTHRKVHFARREAAHHLDAGLEVLLLVAEHEVVIRGQRRGVEGGNENGLRRVVRVGDDAVGPLHDHRPEAGTEQQFDNLLAGRFLEVGLGELLVALRGIRRYGYGEHLALLPAVDGSNRPADRRREEDTLAVLVEEQRRTGFHLIAYLNQQLGSHAFEIERREGILRSLRRVGQRLLSLSPEIDVETLA